MKNPLLIISFLAVPFVASATIVSFDRDLYFGMRASVDVTALQQFLTDQRVYTGPITGNFFSLTKAGVQAFQKREKIFTTGYVGKLTRARIKQLIALAPTSILPPPPAQNPPSSALIPAATSSPTASSILTPASSTPFHILGVSTDTVTPSETAQTIYGKISFENQSNKTVNITRIDLAPLVVNTSADALVRASVATPVSIIKIGSCDSELYSLATILFAYETQYFDTRTTTFYTYITVPAHSTRAACIKITNMRVQKTAAGDSFSIPLTAEIDRDDIAWNKTTLNSASGAEQKITWSVQ